MADIYAFATNEAGMIQNEATSGVDALLQRFPGPVRLRGKRPDDLHAFLSCLFFLVIGAVGFSNIAKSDHAIEGWLLVALSAMIILLALTSVIWPPGAVTLDAHGFQQRILFFWFHFAWHDIGGDFLVHPVTNPYGKLISWTVYFHSGQRVLLPGKFNAGLNPVEELSIEELADLFRRWRDKTLGQRTNGLAT